MSQSPELRKLIDRFANALSNERIYGEGETASMKRCREYAEKTRSARQSLEEWVESQLARRAKPEGEARPSDDKLWDETLRDRDTYHEWADKLAGAIAIHFGVDIGEHSNANCPWHEALEAIESAPPSAAVSKAWDRFERALGKPEGEALQAEKAHPQFDASKGIYWFSVLLKCARLLDLPDDEPIPSGVLKAVEALVAQPAAQHAESGAQVKYERNPRHENGSLMGWMPLDADSDEEAAERMGHGALGEWRRAAQSQGAQAEHPGLIAEIECLNHRIAVMKNELKMRHDKDTGDVWYWQGDGSDDPASMSLGMSVVINAADLRAALAAKAEAPAPDRITQRKRGELEQRGYSVVGYVMQSNLVPHDHCTVAHGAVHWGQPAAQQAAAPNALEAPGLPGQSDEDAYASSAYRHLMSLDTFKTFRREYENRAAQLDGGQGEGEKA